MLATRTGSTLTYVQPDHLGSATTLTNSGGTVVAQERYAAFGERRRASNVEPTDQLYTSQRYSFQTGLYHYSDGRSPGRFYDPVLGRFAQPDNIVTGSGESQNLNRYTYVRNNPLRYTDPSGNACVPCFILIGFALAVRSDAGPPPGYVPTAEERLSGQLGGSILYGDINDVVTLATGYDYLSNEPVPYFSGEYNRTAFWAIIPLASRNSVRTVNTLIRKVPDHVRENAVRTFTRADFFAGAEKFSITKERLDHFLRRHHPKYWDGSIRQTQTFFDPSLSVEEISELAQQTIQRGYGTRVAVPSSRAFDYTAEINGVNYFARTEDGKVVQFYPLPP